MKKAAVLMVFSLFFAAALLPAPASDDFSRAIAYYLAGDLDLARKNIDAHFDRYPQPTVKLGFVLLFQGEMWEATKKFRDHLEGNHRSLEALTGISLANADIGNSLAVENLGKVLRMDPGFAPAYLALGHEYLRRGNYPSSEENFARSLRYSRVPEFKILMAELYLKTGQAQKALDLVKPEAAAAPKNFHFAFQAARAALKLGDLALAGSYVEQARRLRPDAKAAQLLGCQLLLAAGDLRRAKSQLAKLRFDRYNLEYSMTFAEVLVKLKDRDAEKYLYEVFAQNQWHPAINKLMGLFHLKNKSANVQNWIDRALLSGMAAQELQKEFPAQYRFAAFPSCPIFAAKKIQWLGNGRILAAGIMRSGEKEKLMVLDAATLKPIKTFEYEGTIQDLFAAPRLDKVLFATTAVENEKVYLYTLVGEKNAYRLKPVVGYALAMPSIQAGFSADGAMAYVSDGSLAEMAFVSPFSTAAALGRKQPLYPGQPIAVYGYSYADDRWTPIKNRDAQAKVPIPLVRQFLAVAEACAGNADVAKLLEKGSKLEITSDEEMKIHFAGSERQFLISHSDLKNAFRAWVYDPRAPRLAAFDETMFLGSQYYADLDILMLNPDSGEMLVATRDKQRQLVQFNYKSLLYKKLGSGLLAAAVSPDRSTVYAIMERNRLLYYSETSLEIFQLAPFSRSKIDARRDLNAVVDCSNRGAVYVTTYNGEMLKLDEDGNFSSRQVSLAGALHQPAPDKKRVAAFINGNLFVLPWQE